jgi:predicted MPP superfamily phosphohydrolase
MQNRYLTKLISILIFFITSIAFAGEQSIRFVWLSDLHISSPTGAIDLREAVRDVNSLDRIDFVILSGDIAEMGSNRGLELAKTILDSLTRPYYIIPGNHDTKWSESGCTKFSELWGSDKFNFEFEGYRFIGIHQGPLMRMGDGHFSPEDLRWLDSELKNLPDKNQPLIFITHYPTDASVDNWYEFLDRLKKYNTKVILCGHGHRNKIYNFEGVPGVMGRSTLRRNQPHGGYNIVEIKNDSMFFCDRNIGEIVNQPDHTDSINKNDINHDKYDAACALRHVWHKISLEQRNVTTDSTTYDRPDFSINQQYPEVKIKWICNTDFTIASTPAVWKDFVVVGNSAGNVLCLSLKNGKKRWSFRTEKSIFSSPEIAEGEIVFGSSEM